MSTHPDVRILTTEQEQRIEDRKRQYSVAARRSLTDRIETGRRESEDDSRWDIPDLSGEAW